MKFNYIDRKEFLKIMGFAGTTALIALCDACSKEITAPTNVDFTLDLSKAPDNKLNTPGESLEKDGVLVARTNHNTFLAVSVACTHQGTHVKYDVKDNIFTCPSHGAQYGPDGGVLSSPAPSALKAYSTSLNGTLLRVHS